MVQRRRACDHWLPGDRRCRSGGTSCRGVDSADGGRAVRYGVVVRAFAGLRRRVVPVRATTLRAFRTQLKAIHAWGLERPADLARIHHPVLVANGDDDRMVPTTNSYDLARRLPNATLRIYPDAGHGGIFQYHEQFVREALEFLGS
jgi:pimeloyl-ACP methyl ester carboxylesterase